MRINERFSKIIAYFQANMPVAETELHYSNPYELLVAVILSAQCTDKRVNIITPPFFNRFPTAPILAQASVEEIFEMIKSCSYPNNKSKNLLGMAQTLVRDFNNS
jgi:endonuclease III